MLEEVGEKLCSTHKADGKLLTISLGFPFTVICFVTNTELQDAEATVVVRLKLYIPGLMNLICGLKEALFVPFRYS